MTNDLQLKDGVKVFKGSIAFPARDALLAQAQEVAKMVRSMTVDEDNIKQAKKMLASANKAVKELESKRIAVKKELLYPYLQFEEDVKEIVNTVADAEAEVRVKVRDLEEAERGSKEGALKDVWGLRFRPYKELLAFVGFSDWLAPQHLNKTVTIKKCEEDMAAWLELRKADVKLINVMPDALDTMTEYQQCLDLGLAMGMVQNRKARQAEIKRAMPQADHTERVGFIIQGWKDVALIELLLQTNKINYTKEIY